MIDEQSDSNYLKKLKERDLLALLKRIKLSRCSSPSPLLFLEAEEAKSAGLYEVKN